MRLLLVLNSAQAPEAANKLIRKLEEENGEPITIKRPMYVAPEPGAIEKLKSFIGQK